MSRELWAGLWRLYPGEMTVGCALILLCGGLLFLCVYALTALDSEEVDKLWMD